MIELAVFGQPVAHSLSPRIHQAFAAQAALEVRYRALEAGPGGLQDALDRFTLENGLGCNITLPLKQEALDLAASASPRATVAGAANTLQRLNNEWVADNTDGAGLCADLAQLRWPLAGRTVAILGAGGAGAGILAGLLAAKPGVVHLYNRTLARATALAERHEALGSIKVFALEHLVNARDYDLVINATSLGHAGTMPTLSADIFAPHGACYDLNYGPAAAPLGQWCDQHAIAYQDGLGMLVGQAAESFYSWTGFRAELAPVLEMLRGNR